MNLPGRLDFSALDEFEKPYLELTRSRLHSKARSTMRLRRSIDAASVNPPHLARVKQAHPVRSDHVGVDRSQRLWVTVASVLGALVTLFAVLNFDDVDVNWILGTWSTPLIVVIVLCLAAGMAIDRMLVRRARSPVKHPVRGSGRHAS